MTDEAAARGGTSRRRLVGAAAASLILHTLLFTGLTVSRLEIASDRPAGPEARAPKKPRRPAADFELRRSRSDSSRQPAHERPLVLPVAAPRLEAADRPRSPEQPAVARRQDRPMEPPPVVTPSPPAVTVTRPRETASLPDSAASPERQLEVSPAQPSARADPGAAAAIAASGQAAAATAASLTRRDRQTGPAAARWKPREVALLEKLTARSPDASAATARERARREPTPAASALARRAVADTRGPATPSVAVAPPPAVLASVASLPLAPAAGPTARRRIAPSGIASAGSSAATSARAGGGRPTATGSQAAALAAGAVGRATEIAGLGEGLRGDDAGATGAAAGGPATASGRPATPGRQLGLGGGGGDTDAAVPMLASVGDGIGKTAAGGGGGERLGPAMLARSGRRASGRSALSAARGSGAAAARRGNGDGPSEGESEGLSITPADLAGLGVSGRRPEGPPARPPGPRSPERIAAAALPVDGRVRDVAAAFAGRNPDGGEAGGISDRADLARARLMVDRGLDFLARSQQPDGRWQLTRYAGVTPSDSPRLDSDTAATGLALLCFLGAGHDHFEGEHRDTVRRGLEFLISVQRPDGDLFLPADDLSNSCGWLYSHGIASIALCEAVGMTGDPLIRPAAEQACRFIATSRHPTLGGWRYTPRSDADLSVSGWMLVALRAGDLAGVETSPEALAGVRTLLAASATPTDPTRFAYNARKADQRRTDLSIACMTAVGTLMRLHTGLTARDPAVMAAAETLAALRPSYGTPDRKIRDAYLWYYASQVLVHTGGKPWQSWYEGLVDTLEPEQRSAGPLAGSWDPLGDRPDRWGPYGGRLYVTTLHLLALEVPWRHLPTYATAPSRDPPP